MFFLTDYYLDTFWMKIIKVSSFWNIINVFELVGYLENSVSSTGIMHFSILWKEPSIFLNYDFIEYYFLTSIEMEFWFGKSLNSERLNYALDPANGSYTLAYKLVSSKAYHRPTRDSGPSHRDIAWS